MAESGCHYRGGRYATRIDAEKALLIDAALQRAHEDCERQLASMRRELETARDAAKAQMDLFLCLDAVSAYRGPCGERYDVRLVSAATAD